MHGLIKGNLEACSVSKLINGFCHILLIDFLVLLTPDVSINVIVEGLEVLIRFQCSQFRKLQFLIFFQLSLVRDCLQFADAVIYRLSNLCIAKLKHLTHNVIDIDDCIIQKQANNKIMQVVRRWMQQFNIAAYDENTGKGVVRHVMGRVGVKTGDVMAVIITACYDIPHAGELVTMLKSEVGGLKSIVQNINKKRTNIIMGSKNRVLYGKSTIKDKLGNLKFSISPLSFFQVNSEQTEKLYATALDFAALHGGETVIDCYCGTGTISLYLAQKAGKVYGIEIVEPAIKDANANAAANNISNAQFICGDAAVEMPALLAKGVKPDVVLLDPPRAGCDKKVLAAIAEVKPHKIVYVSCNPASLARDMAFLNEHGYKATKAQPVDMFPMTHHVETVAEMVKR